MTEKVFAVAAALITLFLCGFLGFVLLAHTRKNRVERIRERLKRDGFPQVYESWLRGSFHPYAFLNPEEVFRLQVKIMQFLEEKTFHGVDDFEVTERMKVIIAAEACLLLVNQERDELFPGLFNIYVIEDAYVPRENPLNPDTGLPSVEPRLGESWKRGPILLSWAAVEDALSGHGGRQNLVAHEFSHQLDQEDGTFDGTPPLTRSGNVRRWTAVMSEEFLTLREKLENHRRTDIDAYGATHEAEFFAVLTEHFFMDGPDLKTKHPEIYALFRDYFRLDPGNWGKRASNTPPTNGQPS